MGDKNSNHIDNSIHALQKLRDALTQQGIEITTVHTSIYSAPTSGYIEVTVTVQVPAVGSTKEVSQSRYEVSP